MEKSDFFLAFVLGSLTFTHKAKTKKTVTGI